MRRPNSNIGGGDCRSGQKGSLLIIKQQLTHSSPNGWGLGLWKVSTGTMQELKLGTLRQYVASKDEDNLANRHRSHSTDIQTRKNTDNTRFEKWGGDPGIRYINSCTIGRAGDTITPPSPKLARITQAGQLQQG